MMKDILTFKFLGMPVAFTPSALVGSIVLIVIMTISALFLTELPLLHAIIAAIVGTVIYWDGEIIHQYGHFLAAKRVGYPATGTKLWAVIGTTRYPKDEPELPAQTHIKRALGGPMMSAATSVICMILAMLFWSNAGIIRFLLGVAVFSNLGLFTIGALFPPIYTKNLASDGGTILHWLRKKED